MIYRREQPNTPSKRFRSVILNPIGVKLKKKFFYKTKQDTVGQHFGEKVCLRKKKTQYKTKFNLNYGICQNKSSMVIGVSVVRRYKTFVGLIKYSNGAISCLPLFSGAYISQILKICSYHKNPKVYFFTSFKTGATVPAAYLHINTCFFNVSYTQSNNSFFCKAGGTFCIIIRFNLERGYCIVRLPSTKLIKIHETSYVMLGRNSNILIRGIWLGKAGVNIKKGFRPSVRGVAMNPVDHPHGGRTKSNSPERTPWGKIAKFNK